MSTKNLNLTNYKVIYSSVFEHKMMKESFQDFLETEANTFPFEYLLEYKVLNKTNNNHSSNAYKNLYNLYLKFNAEKELNISGILSKKLIELNWENISEVKELFEEVTKKIDVELYLDNFSRFTSSEGCRKVVLSNLNNKSIVMLKPVFDHQFKNEDFKIPYVTEKDLTFLKILSESTLNWDILSHMKESNSVVNCYITPEDFFPFSNYFNTGAFVKTEWNLPYSLEKSVSGIVTYESYIKCDPTVVGTNEIMHTSPDELKNLELDLKNKRGSTLLETDLNLGLNMDPRKLFETSSVEFDKKSKKVYLCRRLCLNEIFFENDKTKIPNDLKKMFEFPSVDNPMKIKKYYLMARYGLLTFEKIDENTTRFISLYCKNISI
jgi:hypothetical protein